MFNLIPKPASILSSQGVFTLCGSTAIQSDSSNPEIQSLADHLSAQLQKASGPKLVSPDADQTGGSILLELSSLVTERSKLGRIPTEARRARQPHGSNGH